VSKPIFNELHEALAQAAARGWDVSLSVHGVDLNDAAELLATGIITCIEQGAPDNPLTGRNGGSNDAGVSQNLQVFISGKR